MKQRFRLLLVLSFSTLMVTAVIFLLKTTPALATTASNQSEVIQAGLAYLQTQQQADGGITGFSGVSDPDTTARSVMAFISAGKSVSDVVSAEGNIDAGLPGYPGDHLYA